MSTPAGRRTSHSSAELSNEHIHLLSLASEMSKMDRLPGQAFSHLIVSVGETSIPEVHQDSAGFLLNAIEGGSFHGDVRGLDIVVEHLGRHHIL